MNRRTFTQALLAMFAAPALPARLASAGISTELYAKAEYYSGLWVDTSPTMMSKAFSIDPDLAHRLFDQLRMNNVLGTPNSFGVAKAIVPYYDMPQHAARVNALINRQGFIQNISQRILSKQAETAAPSGQSLDGKIGKLAKKVSGEDAVISDQDDLQTQQDQIATPPQHPDPSSPSEA